MNDYKVKVRIMFGIRCFRIIKYIYGLDNNKQCRFILDWI